VLDYFEVLTSDRPYQGAMNIAAALQVLEQESGKALDPRVVQAFLALYPTLAADPNATEQPPVRRPTSAIAAPAGSASDMTVRPRVFRDIALAHREIYALYEIAQAMGSSLDLADTMALVSSKLTSLVPFSCCALFLRNGATPTLQCRFAVGTEADVIRQLSMREGQGLAGWVARNRRPLVNASPRADLDAGGGSASPTSLESALVCPLVFNDRFIGTLSVYHTDPGFYTEDHRRLLDRISEQAAAVIHHSIVFEQTQQASLTDSLTGLANTRFMITYLTRELARAHRVGSEVSLILIDLDGFKEINDTYGHHTGDRALREVAAALQAAIRPYDMCIRYAGDEFIVVLASCGGEEAERKRLELQRAIDHVRFEPQPGTIFRLAISAGAAVFPHDGNSYEALLATADARMYRDKTHRKPRVVPLSDESPSDHTDPIPVSDLDLNPTSNQTT
jgi:diguanylate cyclase (GGDEF)-like protein